MSLPRETSSAAHLAARLSGRAELASAVAAAARRAGETGDWVEGADALLHANAGEAALLAFLRAVDNGEGFGAAGVALADICRETNAGTALVAIEAWQRLGRPRWWPALTRLAREAPESFALGLHQAGAALAAGGEDGFADFVAVGLKASGSDPARRQRFFVLEDPLARRVLSRGEADGFGANERRLAAFMTALIGRIPFLRPFPAPPGRPPARRVSIANGVILFPESFPGAPAETIERLYRAAAAHAAAHRLFGASPWKLGALKPLQVALIGLMEDARVERLGDGPLSRTGAAMGAIPTSRVPKAELRPPCWRAWPVRFSNRGFTTPTGSWLRRGDYSMRPTWPTPPRCAPSAA